MTWNIARKHVKKYHIYSTNKSKQNLWIFAMIQQNSIRIRLLKLWFDNLSWLFRTGSYMNNVQMKRRLFQRTKCSSIWPSRNKKPRSRTTKNNRSKSNKLLWSNIWNCTRCTKRLPISRCCNMLLSLINYWFWKFPFWWRPWKNLHKCTKSNQILS